MLTSEYVPHHDSSWTKTQNVNLITLYGLQITYSEASEHKGYKMVVDASKASIPDGYPFSIEQVIEATRICATKTYGHYPDHKLTIELKPFPDKGSLDHARAGQTQE